MAPTRILVIRRDNIGDLICTTPLIHALRRQLPAAWIAALVTRYNEPVLAGNPDINEVHSYQKAKHRGAEESVLGIYWQRLKTIADLRRQHFDWILLPGGAHASSLRFARLIAPRHLLARGPEDVAAGSHEVEQTCHLLARMGLRYETPPARVVANAAAVERASAQIHARLGARPTPVIGIHISARKPSQRWPAESFAELIRQLHKTQAASFMLFWSPGEGDNPLHPGDDAKAEAIMRALHGIPILAYPTHALGQLIGGLSICDMVVCSDGGAMHLAAGLGKPILCFFGKSDAAHWHPWSVPYVLLQPPSLEVTDISVEDALNGFGELVKALC